MRTAAGGGPARAQGAGGRSGVRRAGPALALLQAVVLSAACGAAGRGPSVGAAGRSPSVGAASAPLPSTATSPAHGPAVRFTSAAALSAAVVAAVRAKGSVQVTATTQGTWLVSRQSVQLVDGRQNALYEVSGPGSSQASLLLIGDTPYLPVGNDPLDRRWMPVRFADLAGGTWSTVIYLADLPTMFGAWRLASRLRGGEPATVAGESVQTYVLTLGPDVSAAQLQLDRVPEAARPGVQERLSHLSYDLTLTVGADDLPRTIVQTAPGSGLTTVQQYTRWGQVSVPAPTSDDARAPGGDR
jgi:hypothetical protein